MNKCVMCGQDKDLMSLGDGRYICENCAMIQNEMGTEHEN